MVTRGTPLRLGGIVPRWVDPLVQQLVAEEPAVLIEGPRGAGKSTLLREVASRVGGRIVDLDDPLTVAQIGAGSDDLLRSPGLVAIDEFQRAPDVLLTVKRVVDREGGAGRFLLAGSVSDRLLSHGTETLTGRVHRLTLNPLAVGEVLGVEGTWLRETLDGDGTIVDVASDVRRDDVFAAVAAGGFPGALRRPTTAQRGRWLSSYLSTVADRDIPGLADVRTVGVIARLFRLVAERTASIANVSEVADRLAISTPTARAYLDLLQRVFLVHELPSWSVGVSARQGRRPKLHVADTGLGAAAIGADAAELARLPFGGGFLESFVYGELLKQAAALDEPLSFAHFRDRTDNEVDIVVERPDGAVVGFEVKASARVEQADVKGLRLLRDRLGDRFVVGVLLHTGPFTCRLDERIWATPVAALWGGGSIGPAEPSSNAE